MNIALLILTAPVVLPEPPTVKRLPETIERVKLYAMNFWNDLVPQLTSTLGLYQVGTILGGLLIALVSGRLLKNWVAKRWPDHVNPYLKRLRDGVLSIFWPSIFAAILGVALTIFDYVGLPYDLLRITANLVLAWIVIRLLSSAILDAGLARFISLIGWVVAALAITNLLGPAASILSSISLGFIGLKDLSLLRLIQFVGLIIGLFWAALVVSRLVQSQVSRSSRLPPSMRVLATQVIRFGLITAAVLTAFSVAGINLTALTVLSGAIGVGVGFGLRSIFENFISGIILIFERSLSVGDFVELEDGVHGTVREVNVRSTVITTNDNIDILVPNSQFVTGRVTNWTHREASRRLRIPFGVAYGTDKEIVKKAGLEAAATVRHTLQSIPGREADVWLVGFGSSSLNFELVIWVADWSVSRPARVRAEYYWALETALGKYGIAIPFPQLDLHVVPPVETKPREILEETDPTDPNKKGA